MAVEELVTMIRLAGRNALPPLSVAAGLPGPVRPGSGPAMCEAQRVDLAAAQAGKITWAQYVALWGPGG